MGTLVICYAEPGGKPLSVATIEDPDLLLRAARLAIRQPARNGQSEAENHYKNHYSAPQAILG